MTRSPLAPRSLGAPQMRRARRIAVLATGWLVSTAPVRADEPSTGPVVFVFERCGSELELEVRMIASLELHTPLVQSTPEKTGSARVVLTCQPSEVRLSIEDSASLQTLRRTVDWSQTAPGARPRLLALAAAEFVKTDRETEGLPNSNSASLTAQPGSSGTNESAEGTARPVQTEGTASNAESTARRPDESRARLADRPDESRARLLDGVFALRYFSAASFLLLGGGVRASFPLSSRISLVVDATAETGQKSSDSPPRSHPPMLFDDGTDAWVQTNLRVTTFGGSIGLAWRRQVAFLAVGSWAGIRAAGAQFLGTGGSPKGEAKMAGGYFAPELGVEGILFPRARVHATVALSAGLALLGTHATVCSYPLCNTDADLHGPVVSATAGLGFSP